MEEKDDKKNIKIQINENVICVVLCWKFIYSNTTQHKSRSQSIYQKPHRCDESLSLNAVDIWHIYIWYDSSQVTFKALKSTSFLKDCLYLYFQIGSHEFRIKSNNGGYNNPNFLFFFVKNHLVEASQSLHFLLWFFSYKIKNWDILIDNDKTCDSHNLFFAKSSFFYSKHEVVQKLLALKSTSHALHTNSLLVVPHIF